jgi:hypothetical protein
MSLPENQSIPSTPLQPDTDPETRQRDLTHFRIRSGLWITLIGSLVFLVGAKPSLFGLDRSSVIGIVQISVFLIGLAAICIGGFLSMMGLWKGSHLSIAADIGLRLVATGYVISVFAGMADVFGFGSHKLPGVPFFGPWQARGVMLGEMLIAVGFLSLIPYSLPKVKKVLDA